MLLPANPLGPDATEFAALHDQMVSLHAVFTDAMDGGRPPAILSRLWTRIALLDADLRRN